jgi:hypothetical protein
MLLQNESAVERAIRTTLPSLAVRTIRAMQACSALQRISMGHRFNCIQLQREGRKRSRARPSVLLGHNSSVCICTITVILA